MSDAHNWLHAAIAEAPDHPYWEKAREQEAAEAESRRREALELAASETPEAEEARWSYRMQRSAIEREPVVYARD